MRRGSGGVRSVGITSQVVRYSPAMSTSCWQGLSNTKVRVFIQLYFQVELIDLVAI